MISCSFVLLCDFVMFFRLPFIFTSGFLVQSYVIFYRLPFEAGEQPCPRSWHTFTAISPSHIFLYGGYNNDSDTLCDAWFLDINNGASSPANNGAVSSFSSGIGTSASYPWCPMKRGKIVLNMLAVEGSARYLDLS